MSQLAKGGKWVFGWSIVGPGREIQIPPEAYHEYGFQPGEEVFLAPGSQRSGGFGIGRQEKLTASILQSRFIGQFNIGAGGQVALPSAAGVHPGDRLLVVRGSGLALGFVQRGPIYAEAMGHPELEVFLP